MTDRAEALAEAYRRGLMNPEQRQAYEEAMRRGLVEQDDRSLGQRFIDNVVDAANRNPIVSGYRRGIEQSTRIAEGEDPIAVSGEGGILSRLDPFRAFGAILGSAVNVIDPEEGLAATRGYVAREEQRRETYAARAAADPIENPLDFAAYLGGQVVGAATDPINLISPGRSILVRAAATGAINAAGDVYTQGSDIGAGLQDEYSPVQTLTAAGLGVALSGTVDVVRETPRWVRDAYTRPVRPPEPEAPVATVAETVADAADTLTPEPTPEFRTRPLRREGFLAETGRLLNDARGLPMALAEATGRPAMRTYDSTVDGNFGLVRFFDQMRTTLEDSTGTPAQVLPGDNPVMLIRGAQDFATIGQADLLHGVHGYRSITPESPALQDVMVAAAEVRTRAGGKADEAIQDLGDYLAAKRALDEFDRHRAGKLKNRPVKEDEATVRATMERLEKENPDFAAHADRVAQFANAQLKKDFDAGFIDKATYDGLVAERSFYVPLRRVMDDGPSAAGGGSAGKAGVVRKMKGSDREVVNPIEALVQRAYTQAQRVRQNEINRAVVTLAERLNAVLGDENPFIRKVQEPKVPIRLTEARREMLARQARDPDEAQAVLDDLFDEDATLWFKGDLPDSKPIIYLWRDGKREAWEITDRVWGDMAYRAMTQLTQAQADVFADLVGGVTTAVARTVTKSPDFLVANFVRDQMSAFILSSDGFIPGVSGVKGVVQDLTGADSGRLYALGGGIAVGEAGAALPAARNRKNALALTARRGPFQYSTDMHGAAAAMLDAWRAPELAEVGTRRELFNLAFKRARKEGLSEWDALTEASFKARDYIDFGRRGSRMHGAGRMVIFLNPWIQGLDKMVRTAVTDPASAVGRAYKTGGRTAAIKTILMPLLRRDPGVALRREDAAAMRQAVHTWTAMAAIGVMGYALSEMFWDNEDYQNAGEEVRATHWVIPVRGTLIRIPKPFELSFPSQIAERLAEMRHGDQMAGERMARGLVHTFAPPTGMPLIDWGMAMRTGVDPRTGRPITPYGLEDMPPELQYEWWTSSFARDLGDQIGMSPVKVDYTIRHFGGPFGSYMLSASDAMDPDRQDGQWLDLPVARRFFSPAYRGAQDKTDFYERVGATNSRLNRALNAVDAYEQMGDVARVNQVLADLSEPERLYIFSQRGEAATDRLNPLIRARSFARRAGDIIGELNGADVGADGVPLPEMSRTERAMVRDALEQLIVAEMGNAMIATSQPGFSQRNLRDRDGLWQELETLNPVVAAELERRLRIGREQAYSYEAVMELWPEVERRLRAEGSTANLDDLARQAAGRSGRGRRIADIEADPLNLTMDGAF